MSFSEMFNAVSSIGDSFRRGQEEYEQRELAKRIGGAIRGGDFDGAAGLAFDGGHADVGLQLTKMGEARRQSRLGEQASNDLLRTLQGGGGYGGYGGDAGPGAPVTGRAPAPPAPSFTSDDGAIGSYLRQTRARESGGDDQAANPNSSAFGRYQITRDTWDGLAKRNPSLGLTPDGRSDPEQQERAMAQLTNENAQSLSSAGITINPGNLYGAHFLGAPGFKRFFYGSRSNPDAPAVNYVSPGAASANRAVFFNKDGSSKTAAQVLSWLGAGYGDDGGGASPRPASPGVDVAMDEDQVRALEQRLGMMPRGVGNDRRADLPAEDSFPAVARGSGFGVPQMPEGFRIPALSSPGASIRGGLPSVSASEQVPPSVNRDGNRTGSLPAPDTLTLDQAPFGRTMTMPGASGQPVQQVAQAGGDIPTPADPREAAALRMVHGIGAGDMGTSRKIDALSRAVLSPHLPEGPRRVAEMFLKREIEASAIPQDAKLFLWSLKTGQTQARSLSEFKAEMAGPKTLAPGSSLVGADGRVIATAPDRERDNRVSAEIEAREAAAQRLGLQPGTQEYRSYTLTGRFPKDDQQAPSAADRKAIMTAEDALPEIDATVETLGRAKELNTQTYTGFGAGVLGKTGTTFPGAGLILDPKTAGATREFNQLMSMEAIRAMSQTLRGATTDAEMGRFMDILGDPTTPPEIRGRTIDRMLTLAQRQRQIANDRVNELRGGGYFRPGGGQSAAPGGAPSARPDPRALPAPSPSNRPGAAGAAGRFNDLVGSGLSKQQAYQQLQSEGY